jgi:hypothetical protein
MRPSAWRLTPWLRWTRALLAVLGRYPLPRRGGLGLDFGGYVNNYVFIKWHFKKKIVLVFSIYSFLVHFMLHLSVLRDNFSSAFLSSLHLLLAVVFYRRHEETWWNKTREESKAIHEHVRQKNEIFMKLFMSGRDHILNCGHQRGLMFIPENIWVWRITVEWYWQGKTLREKPASLQLCPSRIPHELTRARTRTFAVSGWRLTALAMARPENKTGHDTTG